MINDLEAPPCPHLRNCSGCSPLTHELKVKSEEFLLHHNPLKLKLHSLKSIEFRVRMDVSWDGYHWGFFERSLSSEPKKICAIDSCILTTPPLQKFFKEFREIQLPYHKANAKLRISPTGRRGLWLDMANIDIKSFLQNHKLIERFSILLEETSQDSRGPAHLEIGQRRKKIRWIESENRYALGEPQAELWFHTFIQNPETSDPQSILSRELYSHVGGFSQTGPQALEIITRLINQYFSQDSLQKYKNERILLEFGSGYGSLTLPLSPFCKKILALEINKLATDGLKQSLELHKITHVEIYEGEIPPGALKISSILVNPPRSGVGNLFKTLSNTVREVIYMSCYLESFIQDSQALLEYGFTLKEAHLINQFPYTPHSEWLTFWHRD